MRIFIAATALTALAVGGLASAASAQGYGRGYYAPRVYTPPRPPFSRDAYQMGGAVIGGGAGQFYGGPYGSIGGGAAGAYLGGKAYDVQGARRYYYAPYMGTQTTTPYMIRPRR